MQGSARKDVVFGAAGVYPVTVPGPKWKSWLKYRVPVADYRYVLLYEAIMSECGDVILFDHEYGEYLPKLSMYPLSHLTLSRASQWPSSATRAVHFVARNYHFVAEN